MGAERRAADTGEGLAKGAKNGSMNFIYHNFSNGLINLDRVNKIEKWDPADPTPEDTYTIEFFITNFSRETWVFSSQKIRDQVFEEIIEEIKAKEL